MRILTRYVSLELIKVFLLTLSSLTLIIFLVLFGKEAVDKGISLGALLRMTPYLLPQAMQFAVPGSLLLATTSVYGRMSSFNELLAIKSLGISPMSVVWPAVVLAVVMSFATIYINDAAMSWGTDGVRRVFVNSIEDVIYRQLQMRHAYNLGPVSMSVRDVQGKRLISPTLSVQGPGANRGWTVSADEAELKLLPNCTALRLRFHNFQFDGDIKYEDPDTFEYLLPLEVLNSASNKNRSPSFYALSEIPPAVEEHESLLARLDQSARVEAAFGLLTGDFESLSQTACDNLEQEREKVRNRLHRLHTEPWRRWANGFSCLSFALIGVPIAVWLRFSEVIASFFACFLPILLVYYPLLAVSVDQAKDGVLPPQSVWLGNAVFSLVGAYLLLRMNRR